MTSSQIFRTSLEGVRTELRGIQDETAREALVQRRFEAGLTRVERGLLAPVALIMGRPTTTHGADVDQDKAFKALQAWEAGDPTTCLHWALDIASTSQDVEVARNATRAIGHYVDDKLPVEEQTRVVAALRPQITGRLHSQLVIPSVEAVHKLTIPEVTPMLHDAIRRYSPGPVGHHAARTLVYSERLPEQDAEIVRLVLRDAKENELTRERMISAVLQDFSRFSDHSPQAEGWQRFKTQDARGPAGFLNQRPEDVNAFVNAIGTQWPDRTSVENGRTKTLQQLARAVIERGDAKLLEAIDRGDPVFVSHDDVVEADDWPEFLEQAAYTAESHSSRSLTASEEWITGALDAATNRHDAHRLALVVQGFRNPKDLTLALDTFDRQLAGDRPMVPGR